MSIKGYQDKRSRVDKGLVDGIHHELVCSDCAAPLADIWVVDPSANIELKYVAECPHCNNKSYQKDIRGLVRIGNTDYTEKVDFPYENGVVTIKTRKVKSYA